MKSKNKKNKHINENFGSQVLEELKKVSWPSKSEAIRLTAIVILISLIIGLYVGIIDVLLAKGLAFVSKIR